MIENNLIRHCICGNTTLFNTKVVHSIDVLECESCGVIHQRLENFNDKDLNDFYKNQYHTQYQEKKGVVTYKDRYEHDRKVAKSRLVQYTDFLISGMSGLDVGSSNSAFVHEALDQSIGCIGLEPGEDIGDSEVTIRGTLESTKFDNSIYDFVTMHDSIEHMIDPKKSLEKVYQILRLRGVAIIDLPDYFNPAGYHHWKTIEHLWFFDRNQFTKLLTAIGFTLERVDTPIPGKLVFYARKNK